ncbi:MAG TPA: hypothetical protein VGD65_13495 [Chryseosolibacter sp.]
MRVCLILIFLAGLQSVAHGQEVRSSADTLHWNANRLLTWDDFKGKPVEGIGFFGEALCQNAANFKKATGFSRTNTYVHAVFDRRNSWVDPAQKTDQGLLYFQVMFNLFEAHARELRKTLKETKLGFDPTRKFEELHGLSMSRLADEYALFRQETKAGSDGTALAKWNDAIRKRLVLLEAYPDVH